MATTRSAVKKAASKKPTATAKRRSMPLAVEKAAPAKKKPMAAKAPPAEAKPVLLSHGVHQLLSQGPESTRHLFVRLGRAELIGLAGFLDVVRSSRSPKAGPAGRKAAPQKAAPAKKAAAAKKAAPAVPAQLLEFASNLVTLHARLRVLRLQREAASSADTVVLRPAEDALPDSAELQTVSALSSGNLAKLMPEEAGAKPPKMPQLNVVRHLDGGLVVRGNPAALMAVRHASPGLKMFKATYAYPQRIMPLGDELEGAEIQVAPGTKVKRFTVKVQDAQGNPVAGVKVKAMVNWEGAHIAATTDAEGQAQFGLPAVYSEVVLIMVEPEHTYWSLYLAGFKKSDAPKLAVATLRSLHPDGFKLMGHYAPYDAEAGQGVTVGVIDSGVGPHEDLTVVGGACLVTGEQEADFLDNGIGHGTHVAGIIAAKQAAGGTYGLAPAARLRSYRVCPKTGNKGRASSTDIAAAIERAVSDGCDLINISMGSVEAMPEVPDMLERARAAGAVVIAATGNDGLELLRYPARYSHTMAVGALGRDGSFPEDSPVSTNESEVRRKNEWVAEFSNYGVGTDFIGPGVAVVSTYPDDRFAMMSGTSMATPFTTGMAARLLSANPALLNMPRGPQRADDIIKMLMENVRKPGWADVYGFGVLK